NDLIRAALLDVGLDQQFRAAAEAGTIDLQVLHDARDVIARLGDRNALNPVDRIDAGVTRVAVSRDPLLHAAAASVVAGKGEDVGPVVTAKQVGQFGRAHLHVVDRVLEQAVAVVGDLEFGRGVDAGCGRDLHQTHGVGR